MTNLEIDVQNVQDGEWLMQQRTRFGLCQSDIAAYLTLASHRAVNQGRIVEVEKGQKTLRIEWRELLETFFVRVETLHTQGRDWRQLFS